MWLNSSKARVRVFHKTWAFPYHQNKTISGETTFFVSFYFDWQKRGQILCYNSLPPSIFPTHPPQKMELGSRALDQNVYSIRCWRWKLPKFRLCPKKEWFTFGQFSVLSKGLTQYHSTFYEFQASHLQWYFSSEGILASAWSRIHIWKGRVGVFWEPIAYKGNAKSKQTYNRTWHQRVNRWAQMMCPRKVKYFRRKGWFQRAT